MKIGILKGFRDEISKEAILARSAKSAKNLLGLADSGIVSKSLKIMKMPFTQQPKATALAQGKYERVVKRIANRNKVGQ